MTIPQDKLNAAIRLGESKKIELIISELTPKTINEGILYATLLNNIFEDTSDTLNQIIDLMQNQLALTLLKQLTQTTLPITTYNMNLIAQYKSLILKQFMDEINPLKQSQHQLGLLDTKNKTAWLHHALNPSSRLHQAFTSDHVLAQWFNTRFFGKNYPIIDQVKSELKRAEPIVEMTDLQPNAMPI
jgi:hypothetical protein